MKIIIDIDEELYNYMQTEEYIKHLDKRFDYQIRFAIKESIPLPKGHGRLIDADAFLSKVKVDREHAAYTRSWTADDVLNALQNSYTNVIIKADKEGK